MRAKAHLIRTLLAAASRLAATIEHYAHIVFSPEGRVLGSPRRISFSGQSPAVASAACTSSLETVSSNLCT